MIHPMETNIFSIFNTTLNVSIAHSHDQCLERKKKQRTNSLRAPFSRFRFAHCIRKQIKHRNKLVFRWSIPCADKKKLLLLFFFPILKRAKPQTSNKISRHSKFGYYFCCVFPLASGFGNKLPRSVLGSIPLGFFFR